MNRVRVTLKKINKECIISDTFTDLESREMRKYDFILFSLYLYQKSGKVKIMLSCISEFSSEHHEMHKGEILCNAPCIFRL